MVRKRNIENCQSWNIVDYGIHFSVTTGLFDISFFQVHFRLSIITVSWHFHYIEFLYFLPWNLRFTKKNTKNKTNKQTNKQKTNNQKDKEKRRPPSCHHLSSEPLAGPIRREFIRYIGQGPGKLRRGPWISEGPHIRSQWRFI